jgi:uncharacterized protein with ParB-like and HNH nuclease domain
MRENKYDLRQPDVSQLLNWVRSKEITIPEIQRPFVWNTTQVRDLLDSLYNGFPVGYIITWRNPDVRTKDGQMSQGKKILIDGQQRITALRAALLGEPVINDEYKKMRIKIAYNPQTEKFEVLNPAIEKDSTWFKDVSEIVTTDSIYSVVDNYVKKNPNLKQEEIFKKVEALRKIMNKQLGQIELDHELDIETVTNIFIRINSKGVKLSQADFAMSKIAASEEFNGHIIRKCIDYFCHCATAPEFYDHITLTDKEFSNTE